MSYYATGDYFLLVPDAYDPAGSDEYPLLVYLHGASQAKYLKGLYNIGLGYYDDPAWDHQYHPEKAAEFVSKHPCIVYVPQQPTGKSWDKAKLISQIESIKSSYRIDTDRMYLHGFSMGASGCYELADSYYDYSGQLFAAIASFGGYVSIDMSWAAHTSIWMIVGSLDTPVSNNKSVYASIKSQYPGSVETISSSTITSATTDESCDQTTSTLTLDGIQIARRSEYKNCGHFVYVYAFDDSRIVEWTFSQSLTNR